MPPAKPEISTFSAFLEDPGDIEVVREAAKAINISQGEILKGGIKEAIETFSHKRTPQYLVVDISKSDLPISDLSRLLEVAEPGVGIIAVGTRNDVGLYRDLMKLGIFEYVVSPIFSEILGRALKSMIFEEDKIKGTQSKVGKLVAVAGARGGVGSTFILANLAAILSGERARRVVAVDLDLHFGTLSLYLNLKTSLGFREALENPERVDQVFVERLLTSVNDRFFVLSSEEPLDEAVKYKTNSIEIILNYLSKLCHYVLIDVPHFSNNISHHVISSANVMLLVTEASLAGLRDAGRLIQLFGSEGTGRRIIVIINKYGESPQNEIRLEDFEESLKHKIDHIIAYDSVIPKACINQGRTIVDEDVPLAKSLREIVDDMFGIRKPEEVVGGIGGFFKRLKLK